MFETQYFESKIQSSYKESYKNLKSKYLSIAFSEFCLLYIFHRFRRILYVCDSNIN